MFFKDPPPEKNLKFPKKNVLKPCENQGVAHARLQGLQKPLQMPPRRPQDPPKTAPDAPREAQEASKTPQEASKMPQVDCVELIFNFNCVASPSSLS